MNQLRMKVLTPLFCAFVVVMIGLCIVKWARQTLDTGRELEKWNASMEQLDDIVESVTDRVIDDVNMKFVSSAKANPTFEEYRNKWEINGKIVDKGMITKRAVDKGWSPLTKHSWEVRFLTPSPDIDFADAESWRMMKYIDIVILSQPATLEETSDLVFTVIDNGAPLNALFVKRLQRELDNRDLVHRMTVTVNELAE